VAPPIVTRFVAKARLVDTGELLASVFPGDCVFGDTGIMAFPPTEPLDEQQLAQMFARLYRVHPEGRQLNDVVTCGPFPDAVAVDVKSGRHVTIELTQIAHPGWEVARARADLFIDALLDSLYRFQPSMMGYAFVLYFRRNEQGIPEVPSVRSDQGRRRIEGLASEIATGKWSKLPNVPISCLASYSAHATAIFERIERGHVHPSDPRLRSPEAPLVVFNAARTVRQNEFSRLATGAIHRKLAKGPSYRAEILVVHNEADRHVLVAAEDTPITELFRSGIRDILPVGRFGEVWLLDVEEQSLDKLS
jgi:hypothetical protein